MHTAPVLLCATLVALGALSEPTAGARSGQATNTDRVKERMKLISGMSNYGKPPPPAPAASNSLQDIHYTDPVLEGPYRADASFNPKGMGHLYFVTAYFLKLVQPKDAFPEGVIHVKNNYINIRPIEDVWPDLVQHYSAVVGVVAVGLLFAVLVPLVGLIFCCCRCCGKCGARSKPEKKHDPCKRLTTATLLSIIAVVILFGVVCAFVTNEYLKTGSENVIGNVKTNLRDADLYLDNTKKEVDNLLVANFKQLEQALGSLLGETGEIVKDQLANASRAVAMTNLTVIVNGLEVIKTDLGEIDRTTRSLQRLAVELGDSLDQTREELIKELHTCRSEATCRQLLNQQNIQELRVVHNFTELLDKYFPKLPDISATFDSISQLVGNNPAIDGIQNKVMEGQKNLDHIRDEVMESVQSSIPYVTKAIRDTGEHLESTAATIKRSIDEVRNLLNQMTGRSVDQSGDFVEQYAIFTYRYYIWLGISCSLLLILFCLTLGLLCGICGKRPEDMYSEDGDCCTTVAGGKFLMLAVFLMVILCTVLMVGVMVMFVAGVAVDMILCKPLTQPTDNQVFSFVDQLVDMGSIYQGRKVDWTVSSIIMECHRNQSMYATLRLEHLVNIDEVLDYKQKYQVEQQMQRLKARINVKTDRVELLTSEAKTRLLDLAHSPLNNIQFDKYARVLNNQVTGINLTQVSEQLKHYEEKIPDQASSGFDLSRIKRTLRTKARFLSMLQETVVDKVYSEVAALKGNVSRLQEHLRFNQTSLRKAVENLMDEVEKAQLYLKENGTAEMKLLVDVFVNEFTDLVDQYLQRVVVKTKKDLGPCGPLSNVYNATLTTGCHHILDPFNGFWASVGWSVLLFLPAAILAVKLATLYTKMEAYGAPGAGENEYLYDAYADRDNMPLALGHAEKKKKKNHHRNYQETYDNNAGGGGGGGGGGAGVGGGGGDFMQDYSAHLGRADRASASNDARYKDTAPKHWSDVSGRSGGGGSGPPRYHHPPSTEYERPPPYYYPGPGERG